MPKIEFTPDELKMYFSRKKEYYYAAKSRELEKDMRVHADGLFTEKLINERRPNETIEVLAYRKSIFKPITMPYFDKIDSTLQKIRRSSDWSIKYPDVSFDKIVEGEKMNDYAEYHYPVFTSVTNWLFSLLLRNYLIDANAICLVAPIEYQTEGNVMLKPVATIFNSSEVVDFAEGDYVVLQNKVGAVYIERGREKQGESFYIVTTQYISRHDQINDKKQFVEAFYYEHGLGELPAFKLGGIVMDVYGNHSLYKSRISGIIPQFDEALREYSDLQAAKVLTMFPREWEFSQNECLACKGTGTRIDNTQSPPCNVECKACEGKAYIASGPYSKLIVKPAAADQQQVPSEVGGFIKRDTEIIKVQEDSCQDHIYYGLSAINFEFIAQTPLNQSGTAKEVDKDELNNTVHAIAEDLVRILDTVYYLIALYRYSVQYTPDQIYEMLPMIAVPEKFDILSAKYFDEQLTSAIKNKLNPAILNAMEVSYATKAFNNDLQVAAHVGLILKLDPLAGITEDDKMSRLSNGGITKTDYIISSNINKFVDMAVEANKDFAELEVTKQRAVIEAMAAAQLAEETADLIPADMGGG